MNPQIKENFPEASDPEVASKVDQLLRTFGVSAEDLRFKWEAFSMSQSEKNLDFVKSLEEFQAHLQRDAERPSKKAKIATPNHLRPRGLGTPTRQITSASAKPTTPNTSHIGNHHLQSSDIPSSPSFEQYQSRPDSGRTQETLNPEVSPFSGQGAIVKPAVFSKIQEFTYRTMYQKLPDVGRVFDDQIERIKALLEEAGTVKENDWGNPTKISQDNIHAIGRIVSETLDEQRLTPTTIMLETSRRTGGGARVLLNVTQLPEYSLFQGQVIAAIGANPSGKEFVLKELVPLPHMPQPLASAEAASAALERGETPTKTLIASGPFTVPENLDFEPLRDFIAKIEEEKPSAVVLFGPFLESTHPLLLSGDFSGASADDTIDDVFRKKVSPLLERIDQSIPVILIPSLRDSVVEHIAFPQPPFAKKSLQIPKNFRCLPNPASFSLDEIVFSATSVDSLHELVRSATKRSATTPPATNLAFRHILNQRRLYPVYPSQISKIKDPLEPGISIDVPHLGLANIEDVAPHVLIVPSSVRHFAQVIDNVICINPGKLLRHRSGGTYAKLTISSGTDTIWNRARVDIVNI